MYICAITVDSNKSKSKCLPWFLLKIQLTRASPIRAKIEASVLKAQTATTATVSVDITAQIVKTELHQVHSHGNI